MYYCEKTTGILGSVSGAASILGSWQVCHSICLGIVALLGIIGITVVGMPLLFLTKIAIPLWIVAIILLAITIILYIKKKCISRGWILFNTGLIVAGTPFQQIQNFIEYFWIVGGVIAIYGVVLIIKDKRSKHEKKKKSK